MVYGIERIFIKFSGIQKFCMEFNINLRPPPCKSNLNIWEHLLVNMLKSGITDTFMYDRCSPENFEFIF